jgi:hypothetical protein
VGASRTQQARSAGYRKALAFACCSAMGAATAGWIAERTLPAPPVTNRCAVDGFTTEDLPQSSLLTAQDLKQRLKTLGAEEGGLEFALAWNTTDDLDLHVFGPAHVEIWYKHRDEDPSNPNGGRLDVDCNTDSNPCLKPAEHVRWPVGKVPKGNYQASVRLYTRRTQGRIRYSVQAYFRQGNADCRMAVDREFGTGVRSELTSDPSAIARIADFNFDPSQTVANTPPVAVVVRSGLWSLAIGLGIAIALLVAQSIYLRQRPSLWHLIKVVAGGCISGFAAGAIGEIAYQALRSGAFGAESHTALPYFLGWALLGLFMGRGAAFFIPNLPGWRTGAAAMCGALVAAGLSTAFPSRIISAALLGFAVGLTVVLAETVLRTAWAEVQYGPGEVRRVSLGPKPVTFGGGREATVFVRGAAPIALTCRFADGTLLVRQHPAGQETTVPDAHTISLGVVSVKLCASDAPAGPIAADARKPPQAPGKPEPQASLQASLQPAAGASFALASQGRRVPVLGGADLTGGNWGDSSAALKLKAIDPAIAGGGVRFANLSEQTYRIARPGARPAVVQPREEFDLRPGETLFAGFAKFDLVALGADAGAAVKPQAPVPAPASQGEGQGGLSLDDFDK